jgi:hypothetical protein
MLLLAGYYLLAISGLHRQKGVVLTKKMSPEAFSQQLYYFIQKHQNKAGKTIANSLSIFIFNTGY